MSKFITCEHVDDYVTAEQHVLDNPEHLVTVTFTTWINDEGEPIKKLILTCSGVSNEAGETKCSWWNEQLF